MTRFDRLWQALAAAANPAPINLTEAIRALPEVGLLPSPWVTWTLIGPVRHESRQRWLGAIVATQLGAGLKTMARKGALGHPAHIAPSGIVPGLPEREYEFHGRGCCLAYRVTGESIDVDFFGPTVDAIDE
jgi:hypothetical protein